MILLIKNGHVINPATETDEVADILAEDGKVVKMEKNIKAKADRVIDAKGCYVMPGFIDLHVHLRDPGLEYKEEQRAVAQKVVEEQLSVRDTEKYIKSLLDKKNEPAVTKPVLKNQTLYETLESRMKSRMGTKVQIKRKSDDKGKIEIDYYSNDDLERIIELMGITKDTIE